MANSNPLVSVIIPNYNYGHYLGDAIESVLNQTHKNFQLIVVDNESTDNSIDVASRYGNAVTLIQKKHGGVSSARNLGMTIAKGDFVCFLDSDDTWTPEKIEMQIKVALATQAEIVYSGVRVCDSKLAKVEDLLPEYRGDCAQHFYKFPTKAIILLGCSNAMISREALEKVGEFKTYLHFSADWDFFRRICKTASVEYVPLAQVFYRRHSQNMSSGSIVSLYSDNELAVRDFIWEIRQENQHMYSKLLQFNLWYRFQWQAIKALLLSKRYTEAMKRFLRIFLYYSI